MEALFACQADYQIGLGHLSRVLAIVSAMRENGVFSKIELLIQGNYIKQTRSITIPYKIISLEQSLVQTIESMIVQNKPQVIIFDLHSKFIPKNFQQLVQKLRFANIKIVGIDSIYSSELCDIVYMPTFWVNPEKLSCATNIPVFYGWDSYLLSFPKKHFTWRPGKKVLITTGGGDITNLAKSLPPKIDEALEQTTEIHWIKGPYAEFPTLPNRPRLSWIIYNAPETLEDIICNINYALTVYGVTFFELLQYGIPTITFSVYRNKDQAELDKIKQENISVVAQQPSQAVTMLKNLMDNNQKAASLSRKARNQVAPHGAKLFVKRIKRLLEA